MGSVGAKSSSSSLPDEFNGLFGARSSTSAAERVDRVINSADNVINPNHGKGLGDEWSRNCALCATATALYARGYEVEAGPRDKQQWRGLDSVFDVDYSNPDNYFTSGSRYRLSGVPSRNEIVNTSYHGGYGNGDKIDYDNVPVAPRGATAVARAIEAKAQKWGNGAIGVLNVKWKDCNAGHAINIINVNGKVIAYDPQINRRIPDLTSYMKRTVAQRTSLVRLDNAPIRADVKQSDLNKMFKKK